MGTELDPISANISKFLYPNQVIQNTALENHQFYQEYDAFVGILLMAIIKSIAPMTKN
ncbi:hypothetical protein VN1246_10560 [Helicobacter pylori]|nr:hypothetical protein VN1246_10560 [Helicobacter pylori]